jgi:hypothetical protein
MKKSGTYKLWFFWAFVVVSVYVTAQERPFILVKPGDRPGILKKKSG